MCTPSVVTSKKLQPRLVYLTKKAAKLNKLIATEKSITEQMILEEKLQELQKEITELRMDPLSNDLCLQEPWAMECKIYDH